jgi:hypothetical protein
MEDYTCVFSAHIYNKDDFTGVPYAHQPCLPSKQVCSTFGAGSSGRVGGRRDRITLAFVDSRFGPTIVDTMNK